MKTLRSLIVAVLLPSAALAALTNTERKSQFEKAMASIIAATAPTVFGFVRETLIKDYIACKSNKAQAVELVHASYFRSCEHEDASVAGGTRPGSLPTAVRQAVCLARGERRNSG